MCVEYVRFVKTLRVFGGRVMIQIASRGAEMCPCYHIIFFFFFLFCRGCVCFFFFVHGGKQRYPSLGGFGAISGTWNTNRPAVERDGMSNPDE